MPDPIQDLQNFHPEGLDVNPLPASEVRRRGDRRRHRNNALAAIGALAAFAVIATPFAVVSASHTDSTPPPATQSPSPAVVWVQHVPNAFPLTDGMPEGTQVGSQAAPTDLEICGTDAGAAISSGALAVSSVAAEEANTDGGGEARKLTLYADDKAATAATDALQQLVAGCGTDPNGSGLTLVNEVKAADLGGDASYVVTQQAKDGDLLSDLTTMEVVRTGNAVYVVSSHTSAGGQQVVDGEVDRLAQKSAPAIDAMCAFSADPC